MSELVLCVCVRERERVFVCVSEHVHLSNCVALLSLDRGGSVEAEEEVDDDFETQD